jgi:hypothetical protein
MFTYAADDLMARMFSRTMSVMSRAVVVARHGGRNQYFK